jgi:hypothetical protein
MSDKNSITCPNFPQESEIYDGIWESQWTFQLKERLDISEFTEIARALKEKGVDVSLSSDDFQTFSMTVHSTFKPMTYEGMLSKIRLVSRIYQILGPLESIQGQSAKVWRGAFLQS